MLALLALIPLLLTASAAPMQKRYTRAMIVSGRDGKCLVAAPKTGSGSPVSTEDCQNTQGAKYWNINPGSGSVILSGTENSPDPLALDAGSTPGNNGALKVWKSYPGLYQQTWYLTDDERIAITGGDQCLDEGDNGIQTYQCTTGNTNQVFHVVEGDTPPPSSSSSAPSSTSSSTAPSGTPNPGQVYVIHPASNPDQCVTVQNGYDARGAGVAISSCFGNGTFAPLQKFTFAGANQQGSSLIKSVAPNGLCLDAGDNPANGSGMKLWTCYDGLLQQMWHYDGNMLTLGNDQALDVQAESGPTQAKPYGSLKDLITWQASTNGDPQQQFTLEAVSA